MIRTLGQLDHHLSHGGRLSYEQRHEPESKTIWIVPEAGEGVHATAAKRALKLGKLRPIGDGLFPETTQTFVGADNGQ